MKNKITEGVLLCILALFVGRTASAGTVTGTISGLTAKDKGKVLVYVDKASGTFNPPAKRPVMDQKGMTFIPFLLPVVQGATVDFLNSDDTRHNVFSPDGEKYNLGTWPKGESKPYTFKNLGVYSQLCNVHPEMQAYIIVLQNPYFATAEADGKFTINGVPDGSYTLKTWHPAKKFADVPVTVKGGTSGPVTIQ